MVKSLNPQYRLCNRKVDENPKNIVARGDERSGRNRGIYAPGIQKNGNERADKCRNDDDCDQGDAKGRRYQIGSLKGKMADEQYDNCLLYTSPSPRDGL